jgi:PKD repeat protein
MNICNDSDPEEEKIRLVNYIGKHMVLTDNTKLIYTKEVKYHPNFTFGNYIKKYFSNKAIKLNYIS